MKRHFWLMAAAIWLAGWVATAEIAPLLTFATIADIQYADKEPGKSRDYRASPDKVRKSAADLNPQKPAFIIHLGDLTDGQPTPELGKKDIETIAVALKSVQAPWKFVLGNHDATKTGRNFLTEVLGFKEFHYEFTAPGLAGWRFVVLDGNDSPKEYFGAQQLDWFRGVLKQAKARNERVICFCHFPLVRESNKSAPPAISLPALSILDESGCVVAWICGHVHGGGYVLRSGVHHLIMRGTCETKDQPASAIIRLYPDRLSITGYGRETSRELPFVPATNAAPVALRPAA
ncbi:MAG: metallophosphoesterase [Kiritimatiellaeota bacterium]|nr:metallophosphoesterase [Kiritimatiellota bacterium]